MKAKVLLVDDHPTTRGGLKQALSANPDLLICGEAATGSEALAVAARQQPDLVLLDLHLPDLNGIEIARRLLAGLPAVKILVFSADGTLEQVDEALRCGVSGYLLKSGDNHKLLEAIQFVLAGRLYVSPDLNAKVLEDYRRILISGDVDSGPRLSAGEREFLRLVAEGLRSKEIAARLRITAKTADTYRGRLMKKLGCASTAELVRFALREGLAE
jgi:DNA-binding NarL/FixJ family response regulator